MSAPRTGRDRDLELTPYEVHEYYRVRAPRVLQNDKREWRGPCPIHNGTRDSFAVKANTGEWMCHSTCGRGGDAYAFEMELSGTDFPAAKAEVHRIIGRVSNGGGLGRIVAEYAYVDEAGTMLFQVVRFEPKNFRQRVPDGSGGWKWSLNGIRRVLFNLDKLATAATVILVEGEKDVLAAERKGFVATCNPMGAGKWRDEYSESLAGKHVVILPDNDDPGRAHALQVAASVRPLARSVKLVTVGGGKDLSDWIAFGATRETIESAIIAAPEWAPGSDFDECFAEAQQRKQRNKNSVGPRYLLNDTGNANRLADRFGESLAYCVERQGYYILDGQRWRFDEESLRVEGMAEKTMLDAFAEAGKIHDGDARKALLRHVDKSLSRSFLSSMVHLAKKKVRRVRFDDFDLDPWLLNTAGGVVDLRNGSTRALTAADMITKMIPYAPADKPDCPVFIAGLYRMMGFSPYASEQENNNAELMVRYLQKSIGCAATGVPEKVLFVWYGEGGNNGKTTLLELVRDVLGDHEYAGQVQVESLMVRPKEAASNNAVNTDIADLRGCRFVSSSEVEKGQWLSLSRVKYLTGMGQIKARRMRENMITFKPTFKIFLDCNDRPVISDPNDPIWNRLKCVPFKVKIPDDEIDKDMPAKLRRELPGILRWIIQGAVLYHKEGLGDPPDVAAATEEYRQKSDRLREFFDDKCVMASGNDVEEWKRAKHWVPVANLYPTYAAWAQAVAERHPLRKQDFDDRLRKTGCREYVARPEGSRDSKQVRVWLGVRFRTPDDDEKEPV